MCLATPLWGETSAGPTDPGYLLIKDCLVDDEKKGVMVNCFKFSICCKFVLGAALSIWFLLGPGVSAAQDNIPVPDKITAGVMHFPPFAMHDAAGEWKGLCIDLLRLASHDLGAEIELLTFTNVVKLREAVANGSIDLTPVAAFNEKLERALDFSNPYYRSGSAIATSNDGQGRGFYQVADRLLSLTFLKIVGLLILLWAVAGTLVWLFERRWDVDMFGDQILHGLGHGIWWAAVTMTTVGYGDKAPKTFGGRLVAIVWMFASIMLISGFTATITTTLTVGELKGKVNRLTDLPNVRVGTLVDSDYFDYLAENGIAASTFERIEDGLQAVAENRIDAFVHDEVILKYYARTSYTHRIRVIPDTFNHYYIGMAMSPASSLREPLNRALLRSIKKQEWAGILDRYVGVNGF